MALFRTFFFSCSFRTCVFAADVNPADTVSDDAFAPGSDANATATLYSRYDDAEHATRRRSSPAGAFPPGATRLLTTTGPCDQASATTSSHEARHGLLARPVKRPRAGHGATRISLNCRSSTFCNPRNRAC